MTQKYDNFAIIIAGGAGRKVIPESMAQDLLDNGAYLTTLDSSGELKDYPTNNHILLLPDSTGGGGDREGFYNRVLREVPRLSQPLKEIFEKRHIVIISSGSGATGSVIGPLLAGELLRNQKERQLFVMLTLSAESMTAANNSASTLRTYQNIQRQSERPLTIFPWEVEDLDYTETNNRMVKTLEYLARFTNTPSLDIRDMASAVRPPKSPPKLVKGEIAAYPKDYTQALMAANGRLILKKPGFKFSAGITVHAKDGAASGDQEEDVLVFSTYPFNINDLIQSLEYTRDSTKQALSASASIDAVIEEVPSTNEGMVF